MTNKQPTPLVSIIVPVYKTEQYLNQCVQSLRNQTYTALEIILVDDGSPDNCPILCAQYAREDSRIRVIHKENGGLSSSRKEGIAVATGEYLMVVDSDDWIAPETVERCVSEAQENAADCVMFGYVREYPNCNVANPLFDGPFIYNTDESENKIHRRLVGPIGAELSHPERVDNLVSVCMKLYRTDIARKGRFVSERIVGTSEDTVFNLYALENCRISYIHECFYHYRKSNAQSITTQHKPDLAEKWDVLYQIFQEYVDASGKVEYQRAFLNRVACCMIGLGLNEISSSASLFHRAKRLNQILRKPLYVKAFSQLDLSCCPLHWKAFFLLCKWKAGFPLALLLTAIQKLRSRVAG